MELYLLTFNAARSLVDPEALAPPFFDALPATAPVPDLVAVSLQEISPIAYSFLGGSFLTPYYDRVTETVELAAKLRSNGRETLQHVATRSLGMTGLMLFAKPHIVERIQWIQAAGAGVGLWNMGNKGAVAMRVGISNASTDEILKLSFVAAHLAPMESKFEARNQDWENIVRNLVFVNDDTSGYSSAEEAPLLSHHSPPPEDHTALFDAGSHVFFAGDLNYRTSDQPPEPGSHLTYPQPAESKADAQHYSHLFERDQLTREKEAGRTLHKLQEQPIDFPPTYKYSSCKSDDSAEETWTWSKHRYPSWCDRILFLPQPALQPQTYTVLPVQHTSDHRPVALHARLKDTRGTSQATDDTSVTSPFAINPSWRTRRDTARRLEVIVGVMSYLALTNIGNAILVTFTGVAIASWWFSYRFR